MALFMLISVMTRLYDTALTTKIGRALRSTGTGWAGGRPPNDQDRGLCDVSAAGSALAVGSSVTGGATDFIGGSGSRLIGTIPFLLGSQAVAFALAAVWVLIAHEAPPGATALLEAVGAGIGLAIGVYALFQALVVGRMSIVAPISATGVVIPLIAGLAEGERPTPVQILGIAAAVVGAALASRGAGPAREARRESGIGYAIIAAVGIGLSLWLLAPASAADLPWAVLITRAVPAICVGIVVLVTRPGLAGLFQPHTLRITALSGFLGVTSIALYSASTSRGELAIVSVLGSLYPVVTVVLAYWLLHERVRTSQRVGIGAALVGVVLMSVR
jgi:drug/metabolite transporter (DMT)-like permease